MDTIYSVNDLSDDDECFFWGDFEFYDELSNIGTLIIKIPVKFAL